MKYMPGLVLKGLYGVERSPIPKGKNICFSQFFELSKEKHINA